MLRYLLKRTLYAAGVLLIVSLLMFLLSTLAPGDLVEAHLTLDSGFGAFEQHTYAHRAAEYRTAAERIGMHLPLFYFSVRPSVLPDTLHRIVRKDERRTAVALALKYGDWEAVQTYRKRILDAIDILESPNQDIPDRTSVSAGDIEFLLTSFDPGRMQFIMDRLTPAFPEGTAADSVMRALRSSHANLTSRKISVWGLLPQIHWHGPANRYHKWITSCLKGDFGRSLIDGRTVSRKIGDAIKWTLGMNLIAILLAFSIAIPLGVFIARRAGTVPDKIISSILFAFYAMPAFWLAMLCIVFLTTSEYGRWLDLFPTGGVGMVTDAMSFGEKLSVRINHLTLPVFCILAGSLAYLTRQMRGGILREFRQDYIRLARAKGLTEGKVVWRHAFRNALFPMITLVGSAFPAAISGSVILEVIFSIPGMGRLLYMSILAKDWPVVYAMVLLAATLTVIGYLIADLLYRRADPRVTLQKEIA